MLNAYNVVFAGLLVLAGRFADLLGRRRLFRLGIIIFVVSPAACALAPEQVGEAPARTKRPANTTL